MQTENIRVVIVPAFPAIVRDGLYLIAVIAVNTGAVGLIS